MHFPSKYSCLTFGSCKPSFTSKAVLVWLTMIHVLMNCLTSNNSNIQLMARDGLWIDRVYIYIIYHVQKYMYVALFYTSWFHWKDFNNYTKEILIFHCFPKSRFLLDMKFYLKPWDMRNQEYYSESQKAQLWWK